IADEFGYNVEFTSADDEADVIEEEDSAEDLDERAPIVTIMGHVDHGKTSLLDYIRSSKVTAGEAGGITQHIGAYDVMTDSGHKIAFLDTPGHEAFTAMRARGAKVTDIVIIVVAADDDVMPQTKEAINHAQVAGVPIVIAINKIDRPNANPDKVRESLSAINILVEEWGGKYQSQEISAKTGQGVEELLEKVLLEAELLELTANHNKKANGTVIEASLDKGRGYVATLLVQNGTMAVGDVILAGAFHGRVKAMFDHKGVKLAKAGPATPVLLLGLDGAPQAGDKFNIMGSDREAREIAAKREQIIREQSIRTKKHITLDEIGRRLAIGSFKELNVIVKGDVDGSVEALSDSLLKLSTDEIQVNIIHKGVGQISESDVLLASASDAVIVGFQVRPSGQAKNTAENEEIEIRLYSIIYDAINDVKDAMEGMLDPEVEEVIVGNVEVREVFKISKIGTVAGCMVTDGYIKRNNPIRLIRDGIVVYSGEMGQLKRFKEDVNEVKNGYECGISIKNFNDIKEGDVVESYEERESKRTL
ncbi:MAG: translation initiation factor IF-2, partial [Bacteroidota bacterium]